VVFADADEVDADLVGEDALLDDAPNRFSVREWTLVLVVDEVAERVEADDEGEAVRLTRVDVGSREL